MRPRLYTGLRQSSFALAGVLVLGACTRVIGPPGKSLLQLNLESQRCNMGARFIQNPKMHEEQYAICMSVSGNTVYLSDGRVLLPYYAPPPRYSPPPSQAFASPQRQYTPPQYQPPTSSEAAPSENPTPPDEKVGFAVDNFLGVLRDDSYWLLKVAHPLGTFESENHSVITGSDGAVIVYAMHWHGDITHNEYITTLRFSLTYNSSTIETVAISVDSTTSSSIPFLGAEAAKNVALNHLSDRLKEKGNRFASLAVRAINSNTSVKEVLADLLKELANSE